jgi:hypothetical protein
MGVKCHICGWSSNKAKHKSIDSCPFCRFKVEKVGNTSKKLNHPALHKEMKELKKKISLASINNENVQILEKRLNEILEDLGFLHDEDSKEYKNHKNRFGKIEKKDGWYREAPAKNFKIYGGGRGG